MGILLSSTIWEFAMLPPSWLPWQDSLSLTLRPAPETEKSKKEINKYKNQWGWGPETEMLTSCLVTGLLCFILITDWNPTTVWQALSNRPAIQNIVRRGLVPPRDTFFTIPLSVTLILSVNGTTATLEVALKSQGHKSKPGLGWVHGLAVKVWCFQVYFHEELTFNDIISLLNYNSSCFNRIVISTWEKTLTKYSLNPHLAQTGVSCFSSTAREHWVLDDGNSQNMSGGDLGRPPSPSFSCRSSAS